MACKFMADMGLKIFLEVVTGILWRPSWIAPFGGSRSGAEGDAEIAEKAWRAWAAAALVVAFVIWASYKQAGADAEQFSELTGLLRADGPFTLQRFIDVAALAGKALRRS